MEQFAQIPEIEVVYKTKVKAKDRPKITDSRSAFNIIFPLLNADTLELLESFYILLLNKANALLGYRLLSTGGMAGTVVDTKHVFAIALKGNAAGIIMAHNHPSANLQPSQADIDLTRRVRDASKLLDLTLLDHLIVSPDKTGVDNVEEPMTLFSGYSVPLAKIFAWYILQPIFLHVSKHVPKIIRHRVRSRAQKNVSNGCFLHAGDVTVCSQNQPPSVGHVQKQEGEDTALCRSVRGETLPIRQSRSAKKTTAQTRVLHSRKPKVRKIGQRNRPFPRD